MNLLPVVDRELRLAAQKPLTYWVRPFVALVALVASGALLLAPRYGVLGITRLGPDLLAWLSALGFLYCLLAGLHFTADCLSEERREGTLGLLFLTELSPLDVVLGKLAATSLNAFYGLVALFPMLALPVLLGGVTGAEIWKMTLVLANTAFFSLATGILASAVCQREAEAKWLAASLLLGLACGFWPLVAGWIVQRLLKSPHGWATVPAVGLLVVMLWPLPLLSWLLPSPAFSYYLALRPQSLPSTQYFWASLTIVNLAGWTFLWLASRWVRGFLVEEGVSADPPSEEAEAHEPSANEAAVVRAKSQARLLDQDPVQWLTSRASHTGATVSWLCAIYAAVILGMPLVPSLISATSGESLLLIALGIIPFLALAYLLAAQAGRFFIEGRLSGALELILVTPVDRDQILSAQWVTLKQVLLIPFLILEFVQLAGGAWYRLSLRPSAEVAGWAVWLLLPVATFAGAVALFFAVGWMGMWQAWIARRASVAAIKTVLYVVLLPGLLLNFTPVGDMIPNLTGWTSGAPGFAFLLQSVQGLGVSLAFMFWAKRRLRKALQIVYALEPRSAKVQGDRDILGA